jgi:hypothetical protein
MIDLNKFIGKHCVIQFRGGEMWFVVHEGVDGKPELLLQQKGDMITPVTMPIIKGDVVEGPAGPAVVYFDDRQKKIILTLNPEAVLSVAIVAEPSRILRPS